MTAFGPYAGKQTIDFGELGTTDFFLITGPTGAGKTAMLDAMCFALYGDTSGAERNAKQMRSDHASPAVITEVSFEFTLGSQTYRVTRSPEQMRASQRGEGLTKQPGKASLWRCSAEEDGENAGGGEGELLASKSGEVNDRIERLMGFSSSEFRQVVILPQGRFRKLLTADSAEREEILEKLFNTVEYRRVQESLKRKALEIKSENERIKTLRQGLLQPLEADGADELVERRGRIESDLETAKTRVGELLAGRDREREALERGKAAAERIAAAERAARTLETVEAGSEEVDEKRVTLERARRGAPMKELLIQTEQAAETSAKKQTEHDDAAARLASSESNCAQARAALEAEQKRDEQRETARTRLHTLRGLVGKCTELTNAGERQQKAHQRLENQRSSLAAATETLTQLETRGQTLLAEKTRLSADSGQAATHAATLEKETVQLRTRQTLEDRRRELDVALNRSAELETAAQSTRRSLEDARAELTRLQNAWDSGQAGVLAKTLAPDTPCPVCGSKDHPMPAAADADTPREEQIQAARKSCIEIDDRLTREQGAAVEAGKNVSALSSEVNALSEQLGPRADEELEVLAAAVKKTQAELDACTSAAQRVSEVESEISGLGSEVEQQNKEIDRLKSAETEYQRELAAAQELVRTLETEVPAEIRELSALEATIESATASLKSLEDDLEVAREAAVKAEQERTQWQATADANRVAKNDAESRRDELKERLEESLRSADFESAQRLRDALLSDVEIDGLEARIGEYDRELAAARAANTEAAAQAKDLAAPDIPALVAAAEQADRAHEQAVRAETDLSAQLKALARQIEQLAELDKRGAEFAARYQVLGRIADLADGRNEPGMPYHRFVLAALLDAVLWAASERLRMMSNNRYTLRRSTERGSRRKSEGLELEVDDSYTGVGRPVATLSGGEGFLASLSLALGLADVVQQESGGIRLDAIFVDEGFGTLDPEALDLAVRALIDLQRGGRMVGIISHVPELKERVEARLEVTRGKDGSHARFQLA